MKWDERRLKKLLKVAELVLKALAVADIHNVDQANVYWLEKNRIEKRKSTRSTKRRD